MLVEWNLKPAQSNCLPADISIIDPCEQKKKKNKNKNQMLNVLWIQTTRDKKKSILSLILHESTED